MTNCKNGGKLSSTIEADESSFFIGGKARDMHAGKRTEKIHGREPEGKAIVAGVLKRRGEIRAKIMKARRKPELHELVRESVEAGSNVFRNALKSYEGLDEYTHQTVDHAETYVTGQFPDDSFLEQADHIRAGRATIAGPQFLGHGAAA